MRETIARLKDGWPLLLLVWAMLLIASFATVQADLIDGLEILPMVATLALFAGWLLAKSEFSSRTAHLFAFVYGLFFIFYLVGTTLPYDGPWRERIIDLTVRQATWLQKAVTGGTSRDGIIFVLQTSAVFWLLGYLSAWYTFRKPHVWRVVIPTGVVLLSVVYYYNGPAPLLMYMAVYTLLALIYVAVTHLTSEESKWRSQTVRYETSIRFDFLRSGILAALIALVVAWSLPTMQASAAVGDALSGAQGPWRGFQDDWTRLFSSLRSYGTGTSDPYQDTLVLGGPRTVSNTLVMDVRVIEELPYGVYWQAISYDTYADGRWTASPNNMDPIVHFPDDGVLDIPSSLSREVITQTVTNYLPNSSFLYAAPEVINTTKQMLVDADLNDEGQLLVTSVRSRFVLRQNDQYEVASRVSLADATALRNATEVYPAYVSESYLQLPDTVSDETIALAAELTAGYDDPFDKAVAVRDYLRANITYNDQIAAAPDGVDPVHYTLFDIQEGYCNYYAAAMAVMLRSQGVPSRVVSGYALGDYDEPSQTYRVRTSNLHTWVEVYFPGYGWIQFEPTASIPTFDRPESAGGGDAFGAGSTGFDAGPDRNSLLPEEDLNDAEMPDIALPDLPQPTNAGLFSRVALWQVGLGLGLLLLGALALALTANYNRKVEADVDRSFSRLGSWSHWVGVDWQPNQTPYERADMLTSVVPQGKVPIRNLTQQFVLQRFSPSRGASGEIDPQQEWRVLRPVLLRESIVRFLNGSGRNASKKDGSS